MAAPKIGAVYVIASFCLLAGCASEGATGNTSHLDVTVTPGVILCSHRSPELQVYGTPSAATHYRVRLVDPLNPDVKHGEAEVSVSPDGIIPAGAIKDDYTPPCPATSGHSYQYQVHAVDDLGRILGTGAYVVSV